MDASQAREFFDTQLCPRWPDWKPTPAQTADWIEWLAPLDWQATLKAVRNHAAASRYKAPIAADILASARAAMPPRPKSSQPTLVTLKAVYRGGCTTKKINPGEKFDCVPCLHNRTIRPDEKEYLERAVRQWLNELQTRYPGGQFELQPIV